jgi:hypothetical protein
MRFAIRRVVSRSTYSNKFQKYENKVLAIKGESGNVAFAFKRARDRGIAAMQEVQGVTGKRKLALAALLTFLLFAGFFATAQRARADSGSSDPSTAGEVAAPPAQDTSGAQQNTAGEVAAPPVQDTSGAQQATDQQSTTDQVANAAATAQPQQSNVVIIIRINSPGDDVVTQTNTVSVVAVGSNQSSTSQNSGLPDPSLAGTDPDTGSSDPPGTDGQATDGEPTGGQAAPSPGAAPQRSQPAPAPVAAPAPSTAQQPVEQPAQATAALPKHPHALAILGSSATSAATGATPESQKGLPTKSATPLRRGGARGRSDASASRTPAGVQAGGLAADPTPTGKDGSEAASTKLHASNPATIAAKDAPESWLNRARLSVPEQIAANDEGSDTNLGLTTLTALLLGLIGWRVLTWFSARGSPWRRAGG